jgi:hypothetical protein
VTPRRIGFRVKFFLRFVICTRGIIVGGVIDGVVVAGVVVAGVVVAGVVVAGVVVAGVVVDESPDAINRVPTLVGGCVFIGGMPPVH